MLAPLELRCHQSGLAIFAEGRPVVREVLAFKALAADLLGVQAVDDRVVDVLEKLAVDALVDRPRDAIGIDQQHGDTRVGGGCRRGGEPAGEQDGQAGDGYEGAGTGQQVARQGHGARG